MVKNLNEIFILDGLIYPSLWTVQTCGMVHWIPQDHSFKKCLRVVWFKSPSILRYWPQKLDSVKLEGPHREGPKGPLGPPKMDPLGKYGAKLSPGQSEGLDPFKIIKNGCLAKNRDRKLTI